MSASVSPGLARARAHPPAASPESPCSVLPSTWRLPPALATPGLLCQGLTTCKRINACDLANLAAYQVARPICQLSRSYLRCLVRQELTQQRHRRGVFLEVLCQLFHRRAHFLNAPVISRPVAVAVFPRDSQRGFVAVMVVFPMTWVFLHRRFQRVSHAGKGGAACRTQPFLLHCLQRKHGFPVRKRKPGSH